MKKSIIVYGKDEKLANGEAEFPHWGYYTHCLSVCIINPHMLKYWSSSPVSQLGKTMSPFWYLQAASFRWCENRMWPQ